MFSSLPPHGLYSPWNSPGQNTEWVASSFSRGSSQPGIEPRSPALQAHSLPAEPSGKPKNTGVDSQSLFQWIYVNTGDLEIEPESLALFS